MLIYQIKDYSLLQINEKKIINLNTHWIKHELYTHTHTHIHN